MKLSVVLLLAISFSVVFASPATKKHAQAFELFLKYQKSFFTVYSKAVESGTFNNVIKAKFMRELIAKKNNFESVFGKDVDEYNTKYKRMCLPAFLWTGSSFGSLYSWGLSNGKSYTAGFKSDYKQAEDAIKECKTQ
jgi:hypothetical protein